MSDIDDMLARWYAAEPESDAADEVAIEALTWIDDRCQGLVEINTLLQSANVRWLPTPVLLDLLSSTEPVAEQIPARPAFVAACRLVLAERLGDVRAERLLRNRV